MQRNSIPSIFVYIWPVTGCKVSKSECGVHTRVISQRKSIHKCTNTNRHKCTNTEIKNEQIQKYTNSQIHKCKNTKIHKRTNTKIHKCTNTKIHKHTNTKKQSYTTVDTRVLTPVYIFCWSLLGVLVYWSASSSSSWEVRLCACVLLRILQWMETRLHIAALLGGA